MSVLRIDVAAHGDVKHECSKQGSGAVPFRIVLHSLAATLERQAGLGAVERLERFLGSGHLPFRQPRTLGNQVQYYWAN